MPVAIINSNLFPITWTTKNDNLHHLVEAIGNAGSVLFTDFWRREVCRYRREQLLAVTILEHVDQGTQHRAVVHQVDVAQKRKVCVLGERVWKSLFPNGENPCGQYVCVGSIYYEVIGVDVSTSDINLGGNNADEVTIPITVMRDIMNCGDVVGIICAVGRQGVNMSEVEGRIRQVIARQHYIAPDDKEAMMLLNMEVMFSIIDNLFRGITFMIWLVGIGTLLAGAIGVSNIMLVVVRERTVEIGIRRAIGATPRDILTQIIFEGITLTIVAGLSGIVFSVLLLNLFEVIAKHQAVFQIQFGTAIAALFLLMILGLLAGIAPAYRAMHIKPVDAMRDE